MEKSKIYAGYVARILFVFIYGERAAAKTAAEAVSVSIRD